MLDTGQIPLGGESLLWFQQGLTMTATGRYEQALICYDQVLEVRPDFYEAWYERGLVLETRGYYADAIASFDRAISLRPNDDALCEIWHERGNALQYGLGQYPEAIASYDQALKLNPDHELLWQNRGNALMFGLSRLEDALACYSRVLEINPDNPLTWRNRGHALVELRRYEEAIASYDQALALHPEDQVSWHARNLAAEQSGLNCRQPTTHPAWSGSHFDDSTFVEAETDSPIIFSLNFTATSEVAPLQQQPLVVLEDDWGTREILLEQEQYTIGRDPKSDICLHSQFASRQHAVLTRLRQPDGSYTYHIRDGNLAGKPSTNGLIINGHKQQSRDLQAEDMIVFGPQVQAIFRFKPLVDPR
ncbi:tetratricopeptide repeat protein [Pantanalinema sp. GBBB05]|uniref:tetratricopeptide repeat protein n=1 Tax=Pantanalinema sp. GBBB05 TaxID=2604139 RepID=UPI001D8BFB93|nr:tetratricopeptide repeat protein [Pantanalinema sp. GBBB05]